RDPQPAPAHLALIAADGSQIAPDRHAAVLYSLVNVGAIVIKIGSGQAPEIFTDSHLLYDDEIYTETGILTSEAIELQRDIAERRKLLELAKQVEGPCAALTDGPVELWGAKNGGEDDYRKNLEIHKSILSQLQARGVAVAGYVDKPGADLVVRLLEIATFSDEQMKEVRKQHPLRGVTDRWLFASILAHGQRSTVFGLQSGSRPHYTGGLALHFFYLNVGDDKHPSLVRVEIPKWVADDEEKLNLLHVALLDQCKMMGAKPYPYILHRAHEIAVVKFEEKQQVEQMLELELRRAGDEVDEKSAKQSAKGLPGRKK
ncbi:MAG: DNA double-strand break repair nuclease NurA, partial [Chloroflexota bacterium]